MNETAPASIDVIHLCLKSNSLVIGTKNTIHVFYNGVEIGTTTFEYDPDVSD